MATYNPSSLELSILFKDVWDNSALSGFDPALDLMTMNCPVMAAQEG
jgi:hypothetical protein